MMLIVILIIIKLKRGGFEPASPGIRSQCLVGVFVHIEKKLQREKILQLHTRCQRVVVCRGRVYSRGEDVVPGMFRGSSLQYCRLQYAARIHSRAAPLRLLQ